MRLISWNVDLFRSGPKSVEKKVEAVCQHSLISSPSRR